MDITSAILAVILLSAAVACAEAQIPPEGPPIKWDDPLTMEQVPEKLMRPYSGPSNPGVDCSTLDGKVMAGYQGWFACEGDGAQRGWFHWEGNGGFEPGRLSVDYWPDVSELDKDELFETKFRHKDGRTAYVFSSYKRKTVLRHVKWMRDYGIDGVYIQRFTAEVSRPLGLRQATTVIKHVREGAHLYGRTYAVMYDTGFDEKSIQRMLDDMEDLRDCMGLFKDAKYLKHDGKPVIAIWGLGFSHRKGDSGQIFEFFRRLKEMGFTTLAGVPIDWRRQARETSGFKDILQYVDIISPWATGSYDSNSFPDVPAKRWAPDREWCAREKKDYLPVLFPGFSWHNMYPYDKLDRIPRQGGWFFWQQFLAAKKAGIRMVYVAMFDEVDEGTAVFKVTNDPPEGRFLTYEGLPSDHYLRLMGAGTRLIRGDEEVNFDLVPRLEYFKGNATLSEDRLKELKERFKKLPIGIVQDGAGRSIRWINDNGFAKLKEVNWEDMLDEKRFNPDTYPLVVNGGGEGFQDTVKEKGDVISALRKYLRAGGMLVCMTDGVFPFYYPGEGKAAAALGVPAGMEFEELKDSARASFAVDTKRLNGLPAGIRLKKKPDGWRPARPELPGKLDTYLPLIRLVDDGGKYYGDAAAYVEYKSGELEGARVLYLWANTVQQIEADDLYYALFGFISDVVKK